MSTDDSKKELQKRTDNETPNDIKDLIKMVTEWRHRQLIDPDWPPLDDENNEVVVTEKIEQKRQ